MHNYHRLKEVFYRFVALLTRNFECDAELFTASVRSAWLLLDKPSLNRIQWSRHLYFDVNYVENQRYKLFYDQETVSAHKNFKKAWD